MSFLFVVELAFGRRDRAVAAVPPSRNGRPELSLWDGNREELPEEADSFSLARFRDPGPGLILALCS